MATLRDLASNLFNQGGQRVQQTVNPILLAIGNTGKIQTAPMRFGQSAWNSFKQAPQQLGTAVGTAITAPFELRRQNMEAATDRRIQDTLRLQQQRALKTGNIDQARQLSQRSAYYGDRTANNLQGFGENISQQRNNAIAGTIGTGLQLLGAKGMTPVKALQATAIPTVFGGGFAALTGGDIAAGAGQGLGQSLQLAGINKITDPLLAGAQIGRLKFKGLNPAIAGMPLAKRALIKAGATGAINTAENELQTRVNEQRGQTPQELALSFGMGAVTGAGSEVVPATWKAGKEVVKETKQNTKIRFWNNALEMERQAIKEGNSQSRTARGQYGKMNKLTPTADFKGYTTDAIPLFEIELPNGQQIRITPSELYKRPDLQALRVVPSNDAAKRAFKMANSGGFIKPDEFFGVKTQSFESPYSKGDIGKLENQLDELIGTQSYVNSGKWQAKGAARQTALAALQDSADRGDVEAQKYLTVVQMLQRSIEEAKTAKNIKPSEVIPSTKTTPTGRIQEPIKGVETPKKLYHGTDSRTFEKIKREGFKPGTEGFTSLTDDPNIARTFAEGRSKAFTGTQPVVIEVDGSGANVKRNFNPDDLESVRTAEREYAVYPNDLKNIKIIDSLTKGVEPVIDRTKLSGRQLDMTNAQLREANQFQSDMEAQALNTQKTNTTSGTQTGKRPEVSQLFRAPEYLPSSQTSSPARENLDRLLQTRQEVFSQSGKSTQKSLESSLPPEHYTEVQQSFKDRTPDQKVNILDYLRTPERVLQKIGLGKEAELLKKQYNTYLDELPKEIGKITDWSKRVSPEANVRIFRYLDGQKDVPLAPEELKVATEIQSYLKEWADKLGLPQDSRIASYITHIFEKDIIQKEFDPEIARLIQDRVPGSVYDPFLQKRLGELGYVEDTWRALDAYVKRATRKYNMDQALEPLQAAAEKLDVDSYKYVERLGARINLRPTELDNLMDNTIKSLIGYKFGQRPVAAISRKIRQAVYRGTLGLNVGSAVRNLTQGVNTYSELGERYTIKGYLSLARDIASGSDELTRVGVLRDDFIQDRALSATKQSLQKLDKGLFALFEAAERINRGAAYYGAKSRALAQGKTEQQAIQEAIKLVEKTQFRFGSVDTPVAMQSDMAKLILQFQSYALKQGEFLAGKVANKEYAGLIRYALGSFVVAKTVGSMIGMDITDMIPGYGLATGEQKIGQTPAFQFGSSVVSAATDQPDDYGNKRTFKEKALDIGESAVPLIPAGVQIKKTLQGLDAVRKGYSESASGRVQYVVPQDAPTAVKAGLLGKSKLPQAQEYFKNKESVLSEKQSGIVKAASDKATEYKNIITTRKANREEDKVREEIKASGVGKQVGQQYVFLDTNGKTKSIDLNFNPTMPKLTGQAALDKKIIADYRGDITKKANDIQTLYEQGQLSAQQAEAQLKVLEQKALKVKKPKKPKKITVKSPKLKAIKLLKFKPIKVKKLKKIKFKKYKPKTIRI